MTETRWTKADARTWDKALKAVGEEVVRARFANRMAVVDDGWVNPPAAYTVGWLAKQAQRRARVTFWQFVLVFVVGLVAAVAAVIAAWPIIFPPPTH